MEIIMNFKYCSKENALSDIRKERERLRVCVSVCDFIYFKNSFVKQWPPLS